jgi:dTDP-D-glucose 4,6-dehydratase
MRVLVTGANSFIGKNLVPRLKNCQLDVTGINVIPHACDNFFIKNQFDSVIHLMDHKEDTNQNIHDAIDLFEALRKEQTVKQIVVLSPHIVGGVDRVDKFTEIGQPFKCDSLYAASRACVEVIAQGYLNEHQLPIVIVRSSPTFGPHQDWKALLPNMIQAALEEKTLDLAGKELELNSWVHVDHVISFLNSVAVSTMIPPGTVLHISGGRAFYNVILASAVFSIVGKNSATIKEGESRETEFNFVRTEETDQFMLGENYESRKLFSDLRTTVNWYVNEFERCKPIPL